MVGFPEAPELNDVYLVAKWTNNRGAFSFKKRATNRPFSPFMKYLKDLDTFCQEWHDQNRDSLLVDYY